MWPGTIAHAAFNNLASTFDSLSDQSSLTTMAHLVGEGGVLMAAGAVVLAAWAVWRMRAHRRSLQPATAASVGRELSPIR